MMMKKMRSGVVLTIRRDLLNGASTLALFLADFLKEHE
jgi:hypothetical protein